MGLSLVVEPPRAIPRRSRISTRWAQEGVITHHVDVVDGFENVPMAFGRLFSGDKRGKNALRLT